MTNRCMIGSFSCLRREHEGLSTIPTANSIHFLTANCQSYLKTLSSYPSGGGGGVQQIPEIRLFWKLALRLSVLPLIPVFLFEYKIIESFSFEVFSHSYLHRMRLPPTFLPPLYLRLLRRQIIFGIRILGIRILGFGIRIRIRNLLLIHLLLRLLIHLLLLLPQGSKRKHRNF